MSIQEEMNSLLTKDTVTTDVDMVSDEVENSSLEREEAEKSAYDELVGLYETFKNQRLGIEQRGVTQVE